MIELPYPAAALSPNSRAHWRTIASAKKSHREWARLATLAWRGTDHRPIDAEQIDVLITVYPPKAWRTGDRDNFLSRCKAYLDGIADGLGVNDRVFDCRVQFMDERTTNGVISVSLS